MPEAVHIPWQPIGGGRASEAIYDQLRELITSGVLKPGDRLPSERAMMEQLHRSRPTIREALRMLEQGGYVASTHGASGAVVQELTIDGVEQPLSAMLQLNRRFAELDVRFHSLLSRATGNQVAMIVTDVLGQVEQHTLLKKMETLNDSACLALERRILARHREILSAIRRQDDAAAKQAMREHTRAAATDLKV